MKAILRIDAPESCTVCPIILRNANDIYNLFCYKGYRVNTYTTSRHPGCPLVIQSDEDSFCCVNKFITTVFPNYHKNKCNCGVKLAPPEVTSNE